MMHSQNDQAQLSEILEDAPKNWGKWGPEDQVGALNYLTPEQVLAGIGTIRKGKTFTLQTKMAGGDEPLTPGRAPAHRYNTVDRAHYAAGKAETPPGGVEYADDMMTIALHGTTHVDGLAHAWLDGKTWNGYDADSTIGSMAVGSVLPLAERGIVGRAVLLDVARLRGKEALDQQETFSHRELLEAAEAQGATINPRDIIVVRTGWLERYSREDMESPQVGSIEPGLTLSPELVDWFNEMEIPALVSDTMGNEVTFDPVTNIFLPLHAALMRNLGIALLETSSLRALALDCVDDGQWSFLFAAAPLKVFGGTGAPVNPIAIK
jgi:kynurenine formamidase